MKRSDPTYESREWLTPQQVANLITCFSAAHIRAEIRAGELKADHVMSRVGKLGRWMIRRSDALAYAERMRIRNQSVSGVITEN